MRWQPRFAAGRFTLNWTHCFFKGSSDRRGGIEGRGGEIGGGGGGARERETWEKRRNDEDVEKKMMSMFNEKLFFSP